MQTKLTLRLGSGLIGQAKKYAKKDGKSLSQMVAVYFQLLVARFHEQEKEVPKTPLVTALKGSFRGAKFNLKDYRRHLADKYL